MPEIDPTPPNRRRQLAWLFVLWVGGVSVVGLAAELLRLVMSAIGMTSH